MHSSLGAYTKGLSPGPDGPTSCFLLVCIPVLLLISVVGLRKQEKQREVAPQHLVARISEIRSLMSDLVMVVFVVYAFTLAIHIQATGTSSEVNNASIAFVDEDHSALSKEMFNAFYPPRFKHPRGHRRRARSRMRWIGAGFCSWWRSRRASSSTCAPGAIRPSR